MDEEKIYFMPGDVVTLKQNIPNKPVMIVVKKITNVFKNSPLEQATSALKGILCRWFTQDGYIQEAIFNTKDIEKI